MHNDRPGASLLRDFPYVAEAGAATAMATVRGNPATDRRPGAEASAGMTPGVIAPVGLNRVLGSRHLLSSTPRSHEPTDPHLGRADHDAGRLPGRLGARLPFVNHFSIAC